MYQEYWGLNCKPFENVPDPKFFYHVAEREEALMRMLYVVKEEKGCGVVTGTYGTGKTFIMYALMQELESLGRKSIIITNPSLNPIEILKETAYRLGIENLGVDKSDILHQLEDCMVSYASEGKNVVIIIDEAHTIKNMETLEDLRMLLNLNYRGKFLITLLFSGQPEFENTISEVRQLNQRVALKARLKGFTKEETASYIAFRLGVAGCNKQMFSEETLELIWAQSGGIPRTINNICDLALLFGAQKGVKEISKEIAREAWQGLEGGA